MKSVVSFGRELSVYYFWRNSKGFCNWFFFLYLVINDYWFKGFSSKDMMYISPSFWEYPS